MLKTSQEIKKELTQVLLSSITELPTGEGNPTSNSWKLANSMMSCGLKEFQGWSGGFNIVNNANFEDKMFLLTYFSANQNKFTGKRWIIRQLQGEGIASIGVTRCLNQFLQAGQNYFVSAEAKWMDRFDTCIQTHGLGVFRRTESFINPNYLKHKIQVGVWTWNGAHPALVAFPHFKAV